MIVGLDFGTTNSVISYWDKKSKEPITFSYSQKNYTPSAVVYEDNKLIDIGEQALEYWESNSQEVQLYRFFKTFLANQTLDFDPSNGWPDNKKPKEVTRDYIRQLLLESEDSLFKSKGEKIEKIVVSVPELWQKELENKGAKILEEVLKEELNLPVVQLLSEPIAAVAYFIWKAKLKPKEKRKVLVCDMGGGTFDVCYCETTQNTVDVKAFDGNDDNRAGVFDLKEILRNAYKREGNHIDENSFEFNRDLWNLDKSIQMKSNSDSLKLAYEPYMKNSKQYNVKVFKSKGVDIYTGDVFEAFKNVKEGIIEVLNKLKKQTNGNLEFDQLLFVGGFSRYFLVRKAILEYFGLNENDDKVKIVSKEDSLFAIAHGATLVAANEVEIKEFYPHSVYYIGNQWDGKQIDIPIIKSGQELPPDKPKFADKQVKIVGENFDLKGYVLLGGQEKVPFKRPIQLPFSVDAAMQYKIGIRINRFNVATCVIEDKNGNSYPIGLGELFKTGIFVAKK